MLPFLYFYKRYKVNNIIEVNIKIESSIENLDASGLPEGDVEKNATEAKGFYRFNESITHLNYTEEGEGGMAVSEITLYGEEVRVRRKGAIESDLHFKEGETHLSLYSIPPYKFDAEVRAKRVRIDLNEDGGRIDLVYNMKIGGAEKSARMKIWISKASNQI